MSYFSSLPYAVKEILNVSIVCACMMYIWAHVPWFSWWGQKMTVWWWQFSHSYHLYMGSSDRTEVARLCSVTESFADLRLLFVNSILFNFMFLISIQWATLWHFYMYMALFLFAVLSPLLSNSLLPPPFKLSTLLYFHDKTFLSTLLFI